MLMIGENVKKSITIEDVLSLKIEEFCFSSIPTYEKILIK